ncbi:hypothetical protein [Pedobacter sp.]|uniref:hypothetical protein n=1 Tax=Pedobacter sp. TaxID=1411316 RepID=UPI0031DDE780
MEIGQKFNKLTVKEYFFYIDNHKKYKDFNTLGLYRSILENEKLTLDDKIAVRDYAHKTFLKTFEFLQLKDPKTFVEVEHLGQELTNGDEQNLWDNIRKNQQRILEDKRIKHRNFGDYSKHNCGYETCVWNGIMIRQGSWLMESEIHFDSDKKEYMAKLKSEKRKADRKNARGLIKKELES